MLGETLVRLLFNATAQHNADTYREHDVALWSQLREVLVAIRDQTPQSRETALRLPGGTAWSVGVQVVGRDEGYQVVWACDPRDQDIVHVVHLGPELR